MRKTIAAVLLLAGAGAFADGQVFNGVSGFSETFQVLVTNNSDGGMQVGQPVCICCEPVQAGLVIDAGKPVCNSGLQLLVDGGCTPWCKSGTLALQDGGCGPMLGQKSCTAFNGGPNPCAICSDLTQCRDQRDGPMLQPGANISLDEGGGLAEFASCPAGNQLDGGAFGIKLAR